LFESIYTAKFNYNEQTFEVKGVQGTRKCLLRLMSKPHQITFTDSSGMSFYFPSHM